MLHRKDSQLPLPSVNTISKRQRLIIGHRGASALAPENTLAALSRALHDGADGVELDVRLARDGVPVVIHDSTLRRTGLCEGVIARMTSKELAATNVGEWFNRLHPKLARQEYLGATVRTLESVFDWFSAGHNPSALANALIYVEMKTDEAEQSSHELAQTVVQQINEHSLQSRVVVVSFNLKAIVQIKQIDSAISTGALFKPKRNLTNFVRKQKMLAAAIQSGADEILLHRLIAGPRTVRAAISNNLRAVVWTVDDPTWMRRARRLGIHVLITNNPAQMVAASGTDFSL